MRRDKAGLRMVSHVGGRFDEANAEMERARQLIELVDVRRARGGVLTTRDNTTRRSSISRSDRQEPNDTSLRIALASVYQQKRMYRELSINF